MTVIKMIMLFVSAYNLFHVSYLRVTNNVNVTQLLLL